MPDPLPSLQQGVQSVISRGLQDEDTEGWDPRSSPAFRRSVERYKQRLGRTLGGGLGLFLDEGGREEASQMFQTAISPWTSFLEWAGLSPYMKGRTRLRRGLKNVYGGQLPYQYYDWMQKRLMSGPFETAEGVRKYPSGGLSFPERAEVFQTAAAHNDLPQIHPRMPESKAKQLARQQLLRTAWLNRIAGTMKDQGVRDVSEGLSRLYQSGILNKMPVQHIPAYLRRRQMHSNLNPQ